MGIEVTEQNVSKLSGLGIAGYIAILGFTGVVATLGYLTLKFNTVAIEHYNTMLGFVLSTTNLAIGYFLRDRTKD